MAYPRHAEVADFVPKEIDTMFMHNQYAGSAAGALLHHFGKEVVIDYPTIQVDRVMDIARQIERVALNPTELLVPVVIVSDADRPYSPKGSTSTSFTVVNASAVTHTKRFSSIVQPEPNHFTVGFNKNKPIKQRILSMIGQTCTVDGDIFGLIEGESEATDQRVYGPKPDLIFSVRSHGFDRKVHTSAAPVDNQKLSPTLDLLAAPHYSTLVGRRAVSDAFLAQMVRLKEQDASNLGAPFVLAAQMVELLRRTGQVSVFQKADGHVGNILSGMNSLEDSIKVLTSDFEVDAQTA